MYVLAADKQLTVIHLLVEGNSIRSIERLTGVHRDTIMRLMVRVGDRCRDFLDQRMRGLRLDHLELDEIWTFVLVKQSHLSPLHYDNPDVGDQYLFVAFDQKTKLIPTFALGKRTSDVTRAFALDLAGRLVNQNPQISTDGFNAYPAAIEDAFGSHAYYGQIIKEFAMAEQPGRYGPPSLVSSRRQPVLGPDIFDPATICTSHVERNNLNIRTYLRRFTRLSLGFSKKRDNLAAAIALYVAHHNYCRVSKALRTTPAMAAGIADHVWGLDELLAALVRPD